MQLLGVIVEEKSGLYIVTEYMAKVRLCSRGEPAGPWGPCVRPGSRDQTGSMLNPTAPFPGIESRTGPLSTGRPGSCLQKFASACRKQCSQ